MIDLPPPLPAFAAMAIRSGRLDRLLNIITISIRFRFRFTSKSNRQWFRLTYGRFTHHNIFLCVCIKRRKKKSKVKKKINLRVACGLGGPFFIPRIEITVEWDLPLVCTQQRRLPRQLDHWVTGTGPSFPLQSSAYSYATLILHNSKWHLFPQMTSFLGCLDY